MKIITKKGMLLVFTVMICILMITCETHAKNIPSQPIRNTLKTVIQEVVTTKPVRTTIKKIIQSDDSIFKDPSVQTRQDQGSGLTRSEGSTQRVIFIDHLLEDDCQGTYSIEYRDDSGSDGDAYNNPEDVFGYRDDPGVLQPGDTVLIREGRYDQSSESTTNRALFLITASGEPDNPIIIKAFEDEEVIFDGKSGKHEALQLGLPPDTDETSSGLGVHDILIDGIIFEGGTYYGLVLYGPASLPGYDLPTAPTNNVTIRNVTLRYNHEIGLVTIGKMYDVLIEYCEAYNNWESGIAFGRMGKNYHKLEPEDDMSAAHHCVIQNCIAYNNEDPTQPWNTDGITGSHMKDCLIKDNIVFGNSDDGIDVYASLDCIISRNIVFNHNHPEGNGCGIKVSAGGGGRHLVTQNIVFNSNGYSYEASDPSNPLVTYWGDTFYNNLALENGGVPTSFSIGNNDPVEGTWTVMNNIGLLSTNRDYKIRSAEITFSDYNFWRESDVQEAQEDYGQDLHSLYGEPYFANPELLVDNTFDSEWSFEQKLEHIRSQVAEKYSLTEESPAIDTGCIIEGFHCPRADDDSENPMELDDPRVHWFGDAPDMGPFEFQGETEAPEFSPYDVNYDGMVTPVDVGLVKFYYGYDPSVQEYAVYDVNDDGAINPLDVYLIRIHYTR